MFLEAVLDWPTVLSNKRYYGNSAAIEPISPTLSPFELDAERVIYTSSFRRLQGKTQVYPLPRYDYLRTRLTHTNEVAFVGKVIARNIGKKLVEQGVLGANPDQLSDIVYAACLAHDVGNPPFGHIGEEAIQAWFGRKLDVHPFDAVLAENSPKRNDFLHFDGNAQGFRILTRLASWREEGGVRLTYATLGAFSKYPYPSEYKRPDKKKKFGFMQDDHQAAHDIFSHLGMKDANGGVMRHPLAFIVEAADDISYLTTDIDDAHRMRQLDFTECESLLMGIIGPGGYRDHVEKMKTKNEQDKVSLMRSLASATLIDSVVQTFLDNKDVIMAGQFPESLIARCKYSKEAEDITNTCKEKVYNEINKIQLEAAGFNVIMGLMDMFGEMIVQYIGKGGRLNELDTKDRNLFYILPSESRNRFNHSNPYSCMLALVDYIAGLTDRFALDLYQRLSGHSSAIGKMG